ncbi:MAG: phosphotransferase family protein [Acidobacteria bacterium]|nr:phosphotransferase family protein [Acidobacteriota bacterium]
MHRMRDTAAVRRGEELDAAALSKYLGTDVAIEQFPGGHSNLTYLIRTAEREMVLRRAPLGPVAPKAHDMAREYRVLEKIHPLFSAAPEVYLLCEDVSVIGAVFYLMERREGVVVRDSVPPELTRHKDYAARASRAFLDTLVELHSIDIERNGLISVGKPEGFLERQVRGWADRWRRAATEDSPGMERVIAWLADSPPVSGAPSIVHNDYKLDNVMFHADDPGRIVAVLDWEMTTVGDPLADLGLTLCYWTMGGASAAETMNWCSRDELIERYAEKTGRDVSGIRYYEVLGIFKLAVIIQQIYFRYVRGQTGDERFALFGERVHGLIDRASALIAGGRSRAGSI